MQNSVHLEPYCMKETLVEMGLLFFFNVILSSKTIEEWRKLT